MTIIQPFTVTKSTSKPVVSWWYHLVPPGAKWCRMVPKSSSVSRNRRARSGRRRPASEYSVPARSYGSSPARKILWRSAAPPRQVFFCRAKTRDCRFSRIWLSQRGPESSWDGPKGPSQWALRIGTWYTITLSPHRLHLVGVRARLGEFRSSLFVWCQGGARWCQVVPTPKMQLWFFFSMIKKRLISSSVS